MIVPANHGKKIQFSGYNSLTSALRCRYESEQGTGSRPPYPVPRTTQSVGAEWDGKYFQDCLDLQFLDALKYSRGNVRPDFWPAPRPPS